MSIIKVDELSPRSGNDIAITSLKTITGLASQFKITGGTAGQALITDGSGGLSFGAVDSLPSQTSQSGKFLTTDGSVASWSTITHPDELPSQTSQAGKFLKTDGTNVNWDTVDEFSVSIAEAAPGSASSGALWWKSDEGRLKIYYNDGSSSQWVDAFPVAESPPTDPAVGGDLTGTASNAQIAANKVGITELNVTDGTAGQALMTNGSGTLNFGNVDALPSQTGQAGEYLQTDGTTATWEPAGGGYDVATTSTGYFDLPAGTTAQRPGSPATGNVRVNTETNSLEHYYDGGWVGFAGVNPTVSSIVPTTAAEAATTITVNGTNFYSGATIQLIGTNSAVLTPGSVSWVSATQMTFTTPATMTVANEPYDVKVTNPSGAHTTLVDALDAGGTPTWTTAAGALATIQMTEAGPHATIVATDPDGTAITYIETTSVLTGAGLTLGASTGVISGDPTDVGSVTTYNFDIDASDGVNTSNRSFNITVVTAYDGSTEALAGTMDQLEAASYANLVEGAYGDRWIKYSGIFGGNAFKTTCVRQDNKLFALAAVFRKDPELDPFTGKKAWRWFYGPGSGSLTGTSTYDTGNYFETDGTNTPVQNPNTYIGWYNATSADSEGWDVKTPMWDVPTNNMRALARGHQLGLPSTWNNRCIQTWTTWAQNKSLAQIFTDHGLFGDPAQSMGNGARQIGSPAWSGDTGYMDCFYISCTDAEDNTTGSADLAMWAFAGAGNAANFSTGAWPTGGFAGGAMRSEWNLSTGYPEDNWQATHGTQIGTNTCMMLQKQPLAIGGGQICGAGPVSWWVRGNQV